MNWNLFFFSRTDSISDEEDLVRSEEKLEWMWRFVFNGGTDEILGLKSTGKKIDSYSLEERQKVVELNLTYGSINCNQGVGLIWLPPACYMDQRMFYCRLRQSIGSQLIVVASSTTDRPFDSHRWEATCTCLRMLCFWLDSWLILCDVWFWLLAFIDMASSWNCASLGCFWIIDRIPL